MFTYFCFLVVVQLHKWFSHLGQTIIIIIIVVIVIVVINLPFFRCLFHLVFVLLLFHRNFNCPCNPLCIRWPTSFPRSNEIGTVMNPSPVGIFPSNTQCQHCSKSPHLVDIAPAIDLLSTTVVLCSSWSLRR